MARYPEAHAEREDEVQPDDGEVERMQSGREVEGGDGER
jgi:hypothetical protein